MKKLPFRTLALRAACVALMMVGFSLIAPGGCVVDTSQATAQLNQSKADVAAEVANQTRILAAAQAAKDEAAEQKAQKTLELLQVLDSKITAAQEALAKATGPNGQITPLSAAQAGTAFLPPPWNIIVTGVLGLITTATTAKAVQQTNIANETSAALAELHNAAPTTVDLPQVSPSTYMLATHAAAKLAVKKSKSNLVG